MYKIASVLALAIAVSAATVQAGEMKNDSAMKKPAMAGEMAKNHDMDDKMSDSMMKGSDMKSSEMKSEKMMESAEMKSDKMMHSKEMDATMKKDKMMKDK